MKMNDHKSELSLGQNICGLEINRHTARNNCEHCSYSNFSPQLFSKQIGQKDKYTSTCDGILSVCNSNSIYGRNCRLPKYLPDTRRSANSEIDLGLPACTICLRYHNIFTVSVLGKCFYEHIPAACFYKHVCSRRQATFVKMGF